ncbi:MAG: nucleoside triphosphate pyrophosphohydrolase [Clostridium sp.]|nr:nucleoside triphosphate pyrophosphohydrolase [Clostridium sp.]
MRIYNKLVRDNIPDIIKSNNETAHTIILDDKKYKKMLRKKLREETLEYLQSSELEELADIAEVIDALANASGSSFEEILEIKKQKAIKNGKFEKRLFLKKVE